MNTEKINKLESELILLYKEHEKDLLFHGWHHISFVRNKGRKFAEAINADRFLVESAALVHDINYIVAKNSEPEAGKQMRQDYLRSAGYTENEVEQVEKIVLEEHTGTRDANISLEGKALSDADTLFKALPVTPILFASKYIQENNTDISKLAEKICSEQNCLMEAGFYFYTDIAKEMYLSWAKTNLELWGNVQSCLQDPDIKAMLNTAKESGVI